MGRIDEQLKKIKLWQEECKLVVMFFGSVSSVAVFFYNLFHGTLLSKATEEIAEAPVPPPAAAGEVVHGYVRHHYNPHIPREIADHLDARRLIDYKQSITRHNFEVGLQIALGIIALIFIFLFFRYFGKVVKKYMDKEKNNANHVSS